jgi:hypothetical protein
MSKLFYFACVAMLALVAAAVVCDSLDRRAYAQVQTSENRTMKPSTTYLHLLRKTPFFTALNDAQLRWTIDHSREWEAQIGSVIVDCATSAAEHKDDVWILLDGGWQIEAEGRAYAAGHSDAGKWFSADQAPNDCRLVATEHSYVMKIAAADMHDMLSLGFAFDSHLQAGRAYYAKAFAAHATQQR